MNRSLLASLGVMLLAMVAACGTSTAPPPSAPLQPELTSRPLGSAFAAVTGTGFPASSPAVVTGTTPQGTTTINVVAGPVVDVLDPGGAVVASARTRSASTGSETCPFRLRLVPAMAPLAPAASSAGAVATSKPLPTRMGMWGTAARTRRTRSGSVAAPVA